MLSAANLLISLRGKGINGYTGDNLREMSKPSIMGKIRNIFQCIVR